MAGLSGSGEVKEGFMSFSSRFCSGEGWKEVLLIPKISLCQLLRCPRALWGAALIPSPELIPSVGTWGLRWGQCPQQQLALQLALLHGQPHESTLWAA